MESSSENLNFEKEQRLIDEITRSDSDNTVEATLSTDEQVIARVTDGIYRQPGSAIRELINNAYDADATRVVIKTDSPRFNQISIEDNGLGMSPQALAHMLMHIGGSAKRNRIGSELGITDPGDLNRSPLGRKLIGKIGIGIFSVAQLTHTFQIITKQKGDGFRTIATVALRQYSDDPSFNPDSKNLEYESGKVIIWREKAKDIDTQGTTIILTDIKPQAKSTLRSSEIWATIDQNKDSDDVTLVPPKFHIGRTGPDGQVLKLYKGHISNLPWTKEDQPDTAFGKLVDCVWAEFDYSNTNPQVDKLFDYYLQMIWQISLSIPLQYVQGHLFEMNLDGWAQAFKISNEQKGSAEQLTMNPNDKIRDSLGLTEGLETNQFDVFFDDIRLFRPIKYRGLPFSATNSIKNPLVFFGKCREDFTQFPSALSGGPIAFEAYLFWNSKIAPKEHRGSLIRVRGASGTLFDPTFMRYQVNELTRLTQITCEIFIQEGFDSALNIDRESFNYAHPHAVYLTKWLHSALRQLATAQKKLASDVRETSKSEIQTQTLTALQSIGLKTWRDQTRDEDSAPPVIEIVQSETEANARDAKADIVLSRNSIGGYDNSSNSSRSVAKNPILEEKLKAILQALASFGVLESLSGEQRLKLSKVLYQILETN